MSNKNVIVRPLEVSDCKNTIFDLINAAYRVENGTEGVAFKKPWCNRLNSIRVH